MAASETRAEDDLATVSNAGEWMGSRATAGKGEVKAAAGEIGVQRSVAERQQ